MEEPAGNAKMEDSSSVKYSDRSKQEHNGVTEDGFVSSKEPRNPSDNNTSKEGQQKHESEGKEADEGGGVTPGLPKFLHDHVKVGEYVPVALTKSGEILMEEEELMIDAPSFVTPLLLKKPHQFPTQNGETPEEKREDKRVLLPGKGGISPADYFASTVGQFLIGLGLSQALQVFNRDLIRSKEREMKRAGGRKQDAAEDLRKLFEVHQQSKIANAPFTFKLKLCRVCDFKTESSLVLDGHLLTPHLTARRELQCSFCSFSTRDAKAIVFHMKATHKQLPIMEPAPHFYECPFCPFETNLKSKANVHTNRCQKHFISNINQLPSEKFEPPGVTLKPFALKDIVSYKKTRMELSSNATASTKGIQGRPYAVINQNGAHALAGSRGPSYQQLLSVSSANQSHGRGRSKLAFIQPTPQSNRLFHMVGSGSELVPLLSTNPQLTVALARAPVPSSSSNAMSTPFRAAAPLQASLGQRPRTSGVHDSSGTPIAFVICEICDSYIKDLEQLRTHMQWIHKVKIHPKMLATRPPLNCQKCQWRFFTDQGLERHLLGAHGLVTSNMQDMANSGNDTGRCTVCGRIYASKLVAHMSQVHRVLLKPAHLSYKCTVCTETFGLYRLFEAHVYSMHSGSSKRTSSAAGSDDRPAKRPAVAPHSASLGLGKAEAIPAKVKPGPGLKEVSMPAVPAPTTTVSVTKIKNKPVPVDVAPAALAKAAEPLLGSRCMTCETNVEDLAEHLKEKHMRRCRVRVCHIEKCDRCLCSFDGMIVVNTSDIGEEDSSEDEAEGDKVARDEDEQGGAQPEPLNMGESLSSSKDTTGLVSEKLEEGECEESAAQPEPVDLDGPHSAKDTAALDSKDEIMDCEYEKGQVEEDALLPKPMDLDVRHSAKDIAGLNSESEDMDGQYEGKQDATQLEPMDLDGPHNAKDIAGLDSKKENNGDQCEKK
ncbi:hypothetical protein V5799_029826 [Amblyomma americanum]|uniref:MOG interacting and ectopic P-granules protein 1 n=1 Tax=Amblyomma americanum TaxID=6943 RepID=A0AAQ4EQ47_AMBAM